MAARPATRAKNRLKKYASSVLAAALLAYLGSIGRVQRESRDGMHARRHANPTAAGAKAFWADNVRAQLARRKAFGDGMALPAREENRKSVVSKLMAREREDLKPSISRKVSKLPTEARYVLET